VDHKRSRWIGGLRSAVARKQRIGQGLISTPMARSAVVAARLPSMTRLCPALVKEVRLGAQGSGATLRHRAGGASRPQRCRSPGEKRD